MDSPQLLVGVGEIHGGREAPRFVSNLVRRLSRKGYTVVLFVEQPKETPAFFEAPDADQAAATLMVSRFWTAKMQDGRRGSDNACMLWRLKQDLPRLEIVQIDPTRYDASRDAAMAEQVRQALIDRTGQVAGVFWAGNLHVQSIDGDEGAAFTLAAKALPGWKAQSILLEARRGSAFNCQVDGCTVHDVRPSEYRTGLHRPRTGPWTFVYDQATPQLPIVDRLRQPGASFAAICSEADY